MFWDEIRNRTQILEGIVFWIVFVPSNSDPRVLQILRPVGALGCSFSSRRTFSLSQDGSVCSVSFCLGFHLAMDQYSYGQLWLSDFKGIFLQLPVTVYSDVHRGYWLLACSHMVYNSSSGRWTAGVDCGLPALCLWHVEVGPRKLSLNFRPHWRNLVQFFCWAGTIHTRCCSPVMSWFK